MRVLGVLACAAACSVADAVDWGGSLAATSDYVFRGLTESGHGAALQGDLHLADPRFGFAGVWSSTANLPPYGASGTEINFYLGRGFILASHWSAALSYVRYWYPRTDGPVSYDHDEWVARLGYDDRAVASLACSPNTTLYSLQSDRLSKGRECAYELSFAQSLINPVALTAAAGYYDLSALFPGSYWAWNVGAVVEWGRARLTLSHFGAQSAARRVFGDRTADGRWVISVTFSPSH